MEKKYLTCSVICGKKQTLPLDFKYYLVNWFGEFLKNSNVREFIFVRDYVWNFEHFVYGYVNYYKEIYPDIRMIHYREKFFESRSEQLNEQFKYDSSVVSKELVECKRLLERKKNKIKIERSDICIFYLNNNAEEKQEINKAFEYAKKLKKKIILINDNKVEEVT